MAVPMIVERLWNSFKREFWWIYAIVVGVCSCNNDGSSANGNDPTTEPEGGIQKKVLIVGIDGCRPDALMVAKTPNLDSLMATGIYSLDARNTAITMSGPAWSSMLSGVWPMKHNVSDNSYSGASFVSYPHFFKHIEDIQPDLRTVSIVNWGPINDYQAARVADVALTEDTDGAVRNAVSYELLVIDPTAMFVQFDDVDHVGHTTGFSPTNTEYIAAIETVDARIGSILGTLGRRKNIKNEDWLIIVSTDHGGIGTTHGGTTDQERNIFLIVSGKNIPREEIKKSTKEIIEPPVANCLDSDIQLYFDGTTKVEVADADNFQFGIAQDFSIECRVRGNWPGDVGIIAKKNWVSGLLPGYVFSFNPGTENVKVNVGDGVGRVDVEAGKITDNQWHMVSATFDRDGLLKVYVNGVLKNSASMAHLGNINNSFPLTFGVDGNGAYPFNGFISEVRIFKGLLSAQEIETWQCRTLSGEHPGFSDLLGHWKITEGSGTEIKDSSTYRNDGQLVGGEWRNAKTNNVTVVGDYSDTPRTVDVVKTALTHLCIPIAENWNLDGKSLIGDNCDM